MTLEEIRTEKELLERKLAQAITEFHSKTGATVERIEFVRDVSPVNGKTRLLKIEPIITI